MLVPDFTTVFPYCIQKEPRLYEQQEMESFRGEVSGWESPPVTALLIPAMPSTALDSNLLHYLLSGWPWTSYWTSIAKVFPSIKWVIINNTYFISLSWRLTITALMLRVKHRIIEVHLDGSPPFHVATSYWCFVLMQSGKHNLLYLSLGLGRKFLLILLWQIHTLEVRVCKSCISASGSPNYEWTWDLCQKHGIVTKQTCYQSLSFTYHSLLGISLSMPRLTRLGRLIWLSLKSLLFCAPWMLCEITACNITISVFLHFTVKEVSVEEYAHSSIMFFSFKGN